MSEQPIEVKSDGININVYLCKEYLSPKEYTELLYIVEKMREDMKRKGKWNKFDYEDLMSIRSLTNKRMFAGRNNMVRGIDVELEVERMRDFNNGAKNRAKSLVVVLVSNLLLFIAVLTINILSEWYPSILNYRVWLLWCIPCLTTCYMIYLKEIQIGEHWIDIHNPFKVVWWTIFIINLFSLTFISFNIMDV